MKEKERNIHMDEKEQPATPAGEEHVKKGAHAPMGTEGAAPVEETPNPIPGDTEPTDPPIKKPIPSPIPPEA